MLVLRDSACLTFSIADFSFFSSGVFDFYSGFRLLCASRIYFSSFSSLISDCSGVETCLGSRVQALFVLLTSSFKELFAFVVSLLSLLGFVV